MPKQQVAESVGVQSARREGQGLRKVALEIHALMQDADDIDAFGDEAVKQEMRAAGNFVVASANVKGIPVLLSDAPLRLGCAAKYRGCTSPPDPVPSGRPCNPKSRQGRFERAVRGHSRLSYGRGLFVPFARNESLEIKRRRWASFLALDKRGAQRGQLGFPFLKESQGGTHDIACVTVAPLLHLSIDEVHEVVANAERRVLARHKALLSRFVPKFGISGNRQVGPYLLMTVTSDTIDSKFTARI